MQAEATEETKHDLDPKTWPLMLRSLEPMTFDAAEVFPPETATGVTADSVATGEVEPIVVVDAAEDKVKGNTKTVNMCFGDNFVLDTMEVPSAKIIPLIIRGVALDLFPDSERFKSNDYYFAYTYTGTKLVFAILKSKSYLAGKVPGFLPAMLTPGKYIYRHGSQYYVFEHDEEGTVTTKVHQEIQHDCIDLQEFADAGETSKIPQSLHLQWSLTHHYKPVTFIMLFVFIALLAGYGATMRGYKEVTVKTARLSGVATVVPSKNGMAPVGMFIKSVADVTSPLGATIKQIKKIDKSNLAFVVQFKTENDTRDFIARKGGRYEDGKVVFAFDLARNGQSGSGN